jgi:hypothetical protein
MSLKKGIMPLLVVISMVSASFAHAEEGQKLNILLNVPYFHQVRDLTEKNKQIAENTACGPTVAAIMLQNDGMNVDVNDVLAIVPNYVYQPRVGFYRMDKFAPYFNKEAVLIDFSHKNIYDALNQGKAVFLNVKNYDGSYGHALAIVGMKGFDGEKAESLIIHDVWVGPYREFKFTSNDTLEQPEGYTNYINKSLLFYIK